MLDTGLFDGFDQQQIAAIRSARLAEIEQAGRARAMKKTHKLQVRRAKSEATLADILPATVADGESWHVISHGDIDSLSYLAHFIKHVEYFDYVAISTWCMGGADLDLIEGWIESGRIESLALYVGEIFPSQYGDEYTRAVEMSERYGFRLVVAKNHSKIMLASGGGAHLVMESSANVNTNPRIEQTAIHASRELFDFYRDFFDGLKTIDRRR
jgi:hypothetical protein